MAFFISSPTGVELTELSFRLNSSLLKCLTLTAAGEYLLAPLGISRYNLPSFWLISTGLMIRLSSILPLVVRTPFFIIPKIGFLSVEDTLGISDRLLSVLP